MDKIKDLKEQNIAGICGKKIKLLRERYGYSQEKLADLLECSPETIGRVERGIQTMKFWRLIRVCELFHVSLDYLLRDFDPTDLAPVPSYVVKLFQDAGEVEFEALSENISSVARMIDYIRFLENKLLEYPPDKQTDEYIRNRRKRK